MVSVPPPSWFAHLREVRTADATIEKLLKTAAAQAYAAIRDLRLGTLSEAIRAHQLSQAYVSVSLAIGDMYGKLTPTVTANMQRAMATAGDGMWAVDAVLGRNAGALRQSFLNGSLRNIENALSKFQNNIDLSAQVYRTQALSLGWVNREINAGLLLGRSAREIAASVRDMILPNVRGGVSYAAMRLGRTELNNAFHLTTISLAQNRPWIKAMEWHLSGSHPRTDECDDLASGGPYRATDVPPKPHPQCLCYITPVVLSESDFLDQLNAGAYDSWML